MQNFSDLPKEYSTQELLKLAKSPTGQQLLNTLQQKGGDELRLAMSKAAEGDYTQAKQAISALMENPEVKKLLDQLGR